jgi:hypothetical protein
MRWKPQLVATDRKGFRLIWRFLRPLHLRAAGTRLARDCLRAVRRQAGAAEDLMDEWTAGPLVREIIEACAAAGTAKQKLAVLADGYRAIYNVSGDIIPLAPLTPESSPTAPASAPEWQTHLRHRRAAALGFRVWTTSVHSRGGFGMPRG